MGPWWLLRVEVCPFRGAPGSPLCWWWACAGETGRGGRFSFGLSKSSV